MDTAVSYARQLATYIASPTKIEALTRLEFDNAPPLHIIAQMRLRVERAAKPPRRARYCPDSTRHDGDTFKPRSLVKIEKPKPVKLPPIDLPPPTFVRAGEADKPMPESLIGAIAADFGTDLESVLSKQRALIPTRARQTIFAILCAKGFTRSQVGRWMQRDHSTVVYGVDRFDAYAAYFPAMREIFTKWTGQ